MHREERQRQVDQLFSSAAAYWDEVYRARSVEGIVYRTRQERVLRWVDELGLPAHSTVLEIGCGAGLLTAALAERGFRVLAVDTVPEMVERTRRRAREHGLDGLVSARVGDVQALGLESGAVELAVAIGVLPWLHEPAAALRELARVARASGHVLFSTDNAARLAHLLDPRLNPYLSPVRERVKAALGRAGLPPSVHTDAWRREVDRLVAESGLVKKKGTTVGFAPLSAWGHPVLTGRAGGAFQRRAQALADRGLPALRSAGAQYLVLAQKPPQSR